VLWLALSPCLPTRPGATLLLSCFSDADPAREEWPIQPGRPEVSEQTLHDVFGGTGWDIESLKPAAVDGTEIEMAFWYIRAQRRELT
jgi:hypothetical protein